MLQFNLETLMLCLVAGVAMFLLFVIHSTLIKIQAASQFVLCKLITRIRVLLRN